jgi:ornithine cyclodeaminase
MSPSMRLCGSYSQSRIEGDMQQLPADFPVTELWEVLVGRAPGRESDEQVTIFDSVGFALEDYTALRYVYEQAILRNIGVDVELVPTPDDPKDLFSYTRGGRQRMPVRRAS